MTDVLRPGALDEDRDERTRRIGWVDLNNVAEANCLVVGAGALGNEVVKDLLLFGFRRMTVLDMDRVVRSNLSRCVMFRDGDADVGEHKANVVRDRGNEIVPEARIESQVCKVQEIGVEDMRGYDIVFGCLDNIMARLHVNSHSYLAGVPYIDGGTNGFSGKVQVIDPPGSPCLQCGMNRSHFRIMERRFSCTGADTVFYDPKMPAEITTTSIIAAMQVREAVKLLSGRREETLKNVLFYNGVRNTMDVLQLEIDPQCPNHIDKG